MTPPYEMNFSAFASAIDPGFAVGLTPRTSPSTLPLTWLAEVWDSTQNRLTYWVHWNNVELAKQLPGAAQRYRFADATLHPIAQSLDLDPCCQPDCKLIAGLLATCQSWIAALQSECAQRLQEDRPSTLNTDLADDYLVLTSHWIAHWWVLEKVQAHRLAKARAVPPLEQTAPERSRDPNWPSAMVIHAQSQPLLPAEQAYRSKRQEDIGYWLEQFDSENRRWSSEFEVNIWEAQADIDLAHRKIGELERLIEKQRSFIVRAQITIRRNQREEARVRTIARRGRPKLSQERQDVAAQFTAQWVQSLLNVLEATSCNQLETRIAGSNQRNWRRWLKGDFVPTTTSLAALEKASVTSGHHQGKVLRELPVTPSYEDLLALIRLCGVVLTGASPESTSLNLPI